MMSHSLDGRIVLVNSRLRTHLGVKSRILRRPVWGTPRAPTASKHPRNLIGTLMPTDWRNLAFDEAEEGPRLTVVLLFYGPGTGRVFKLVIPESVEEIHCYFIILIFWDASEVKE